MKKLLFSAALTGFVLLCGKAQSQDHKLIKLWETDTLLKVPESVRYDAARKVLYTANIEGKPWEKDGQGSIGKVGLDGRIIASEWVTGLNAPKGMDIHAGKLYVADVDVVVVIDIAGGKIIQRIAIDGAKGLNDLSIDTNGAIYVSDSQTKKIHRITNGQSTVVIENLSGPNGVLMVGSDLYLTNSGGLYKHEKTGALTQIADGMEGGTDGIEPVGNGDFIVSCWAGSIWYVHANGKKEHLLDTREQKINSADIGYDPVSKTVYVPTFFKNNVVAYRLQ
ncbi:MAG: ATP/GTP-binding protein [Chitinophagaceae bacterium]|nr:ATP/GTP-binding protein [Chitinophagaceae bacterium]